MGKLKSPQRFSDIFKIKPALLDSVGALDPTLRADTRLFIDPLLLAKSKHREFSKSAVDRYQSHFENVVKLLAVSKKKGDVAWKAAEKRLSFPEVKWTCLGYGGDTVAGSGTGVFTRASVMDTARQIVELGIDDPDLFVSLALLEDGIGPDRISDMVTNIIFPDLVSYNERILPKLAIPTERFEITLKNGVTAAGQLAKNPFLTTRGPVILVPKDVLRDLPIAADWSDVSTAAAHNLVLRAKVNEHIANIWKTKTKQDKDQVRRWALSSKENFNLFLEMLRGAQPKAYDFLSDPMGELVWRRIAQEIAIQEPLKLTIGKANDLKALREVVRQIIAQFRFLIETRHLSEELYHQGKPRPERSAQHLFFAVAYAYCMANEIDVTPEADTGNGIVDFKFSTGFEKRVLVEIKLSRNPRLTHGYEKQIERYKKAEQTGSGFFLVVDVGGPPNWQEKLLALKNSSAKDGIALADLEFVDGTPKKSASRSD